MLAFHAALPGLPLRRLRIAALSEPTTASQFLRDTLDPQRFVWHIRHQATQLLGELSRESFDAILVHWGVRPAMAMEFLGHTRHGGRPIHAPILAIGVPDNESIVAAFEAGVDNCLTDPPDPRALRARIISAVRRATLQPGADRILRLAALELDLNDRTARWNGHHIALPGHEFDVALSLVQYAGHGMSRGHLLDSVWDAPPSERTRVVDACVHRIRTRIGAVCADAVRIVTLRDFGYRLELHNA